MDRVTLFIVLYLSTSHVNGQYEQCGGGTEPKCNKVRSVLHLVEDISCHAGDPSVNQEGSYRTYSPLINKLGEIVRLTRDVVTGLEFEQFEECLPKEYETPYLCNPPPMNCNNIGPDVYASYDGTCNNLNNARWGSIGEAQRRLRPPVYDQNFYKARLNGVDGHPLPNPRHLSNKIFKQPEEESKDRHDEFTMWVWAFAQLIDHDITLTPTIKDNEDKTIDCCAKQMGECPIACMPIPIPKDDPHFNKTGNRNPINMISAYIDANPTYGNSVKQAKAFRANDGTGAKLKVNTHTNEGTYLPRNDDQTDACIDSATISKNPEIPHCLISGDTRLHVVPSLTALMTMFNREHNRIVDRLAALNNGWDDERLYQEARKIVIAEYQMFALRDLVAGMLLGEQLADKFNLNEKTGYDDIYDPNINAQMSVAFSTAAYRVGHGLVNSQLLVERDAAFPTRHIVLCCHQLMSGFAIQIFNMLFVIAKSASVFSFNRIHGQYDKANENQILDDPIHNNFDRAAMNFLHDGPSGILRMLSQKCMGKVDSHLSESIRDFLFLNLDTLISMDLGALKIQRGRDHGLPTYNEWRRHFGLPVFPDSHTDQVLANKIRQAYVWKEGEIDLFLGALTEDHVDGGLVGPLFGEILGEQFQRLKYGDRFYYQNPQDGGPNPQTVAGRFKSKEQVESLQGLTLARVLCENTETVKIQKNIFKKQSDENPWVYCNDYDKLPDIDFNWWRE